MALLRGPVALFAVGDIPAKLTRSQLLAATAAAQSSQDYVVATDGRPLTLRPFSAMADERYRFYQQVEG